MFRTPRFPYSSAPTPASLPHSLVPLHIADIHPGLGSSTYVLSHLQQLHIVKTVSCLSQRHRAGLLHKNFPATSHIVNICDLTSIKAYQAVSKAHGLIFSNEHKACTPRLSAYILEALFLIHLVSPYFAIIFGPVNTSFSSTEDATIRLHAARFGFNVTSNHHHTRHLMPHRSYQSSWILTRTDTVPHTDQTTDLQHIISLLQQQSSLPPTICHRRSLLNLPLTPVHPDILSTAERSAALTTRDTGDQLGPLSPSYGSANLTPYDRWIFHEQKPFWVPTRAFARATGFPDSFQLYQDQSESVAALAHSTSPITVALTLSIALLLVGINLLSSPTSPITQIILHAIPTHIVPELSLLSQLCIIGTTKSLAQLLIRSTQSTAIEAALILITHGITSTGTLSQTCSLPGFLSSLPSHLQHHIRLVASQANNLHPIPCNYSPPNIHLPDHLRSVLHNLPQAQQTGFLRYISPLLSPLHPLTQGIPRAYFQIIHQHEPTTTNQQHSILHISLCLAAIQDTAARIIPYLIPPFVPIEILHRTICIMLLKNFSPRCFSTAHTACITTRSFLGRF